MDNKELDDIEDGHFIHLLLEVYCAYDWDKDKKVETPKFCKKGIKKPGYHCLENDCKFSAYTYADYEICYAGELGKVPSDNHWIGFGGDMESEENDKGKNKKLIELWESICKRKVSEAYEEFTKLKNSI